MRSNKGVITLVVMIVAIVFFCGFLPGILQSVGIPKAVRPVIALPGEKLTETPIIPLGGNEWSDIYLTNTLVATWITYGILIILALLAQAGIRSEVPGGITNLLEMAVEALYNIAEGVVGSRWVRRIFPIAATTFLLILFANWLEMIPLVDSFGFVHHAAEAHQESGHPVKEIGNTGLFMLDTSIEIPVEEHAEEVEGEGEEHGAEEGEEAAEGFNPNEAYVITPIVRPAATDINFPLGLAVVTFVAIQIFGVMSLGAHYAGKFINVGALERGGMGFMDFAVGLLELVLEPVKMVSLTFRLLGNVFGGSVLLFVVSTLIPNLNFLLPTGLYLYEMFVGAIQAYVFFMLTLVYAATAMAGHGGEEHH